MKRAISRVNCKLISQVLTDGKIRSQNLDASHLNVVAFSYPPPEFNI